MNKKDLPVMYSSVFWCLLSCYCFFFGWWGVGGGALLRINHCSSLKRTESNLVILIWQGPGPLTTKNAIFSAKIQFTLMFFSPQEENFLFLSGRSAQKSLIISPSNGTICA